MNKAAGAHVYAALGGGEGGGGKGGGREGGGREGGGREGGGREGPAVDVRVKEAVHTY